MLAKLTNVQRTEQFYRRTRHALGPLCHPASETRDALHPSAYRPTLGFDCHSTLDTIHRSSYFPNSR